MNHSLSNSMNMFPVIDQHATRMASIIHHSQKQLIYTANLSEASQLLSKQLIDATRLSSKSRVYIQTLSRYA